MSHKNKRLFRILITVFVAYFTDFSQQMSAQETDFWFVVPHFEDTGSSTLTNYNRPVFFMITAGDLPAVVTMEMPALPGFNTRVVSLLAGESKRIIFGTDYSAFSNAQMDTIQNNIHNSLYVGVKHNRGIHFHSTAPVTIYYQLDSYASKEMFALKGTKALGLEFYTPFQTNFLTADRYPRAYAQFHIVATEDNTTVNITPKADIVGTSAGVTKTVVLNRGETFAARTNLFMQASRLSGSHIIADKPIAVTVTDDLLAIGAPADATGDQLVPVANLGTTHIVVRGFTTQSSAVGDRIYILATQDNTTITIDGITVASSLAKGSQYMHQMITALTAVITTNHPVYVYQLSGYGEELGAALLPSMYSISSKRITFYKSSNAFNHNIFMLVRAGNENGFTVNGNAGILTAADFMNVPNMAGWKYTRKDISSAVLSGTVVINNNSGPFALGYFYTGASFGNSASFGYLSQFGALSFPDTTYICEGSSVVLDAGYAKSYYWTLPDGTHPTTPTVTAIDTGMYSVTVDLDPALHTVSTRVLRRFEGSAIVSSPASNSGAGTYIYIANTGLYSAQHISYIWLVDGTPVSTQSSFTVTWNAGDEKVITLQLKDTILNCTKIHTLLHRSDPEFYVNDIHYLALATEVICTQPTQFRAETGSNVSSLPGHLKWYINGIEEVAAQDQLIWSKTFTPGTYQLKMVVLLDDDVTTKTLEASLRVVVCELILSSTGFTSANCVQLQWDWSPFTPAGNYGFTLYQWDNVLGDWQTTSTNYDRTIKVLNVYPNIAASNTLQTWMHDPAIGLGKINVTPVTITNFNANPNSYLKNASGEYQYDVIMFGSWDYNNHIDLTSVSAIAVRNFLNSGRGVLFGHDTQTYLDNKINFCSLADKTNLHLIPHTISLERGSNSTKVVNNGFLLKYPHLIPYNSILTIPPTHSTAQFAKGIVWMNFPNTWGHFTSPPLIVNGGTNDFYLTTWNNAAMIQTGHSNGTSTIDERKIIANTLWYLAQFTAETAATVCSVPDLAVPETPAVNRQSANCSRIDISSFDYGTEYKFYVKATNSYNPDDIVISNELTVENKTGLRGFFISEDNNPSGVPDTSNPATTFIPAADNVLVSYTIQNLAHYVHIQAIDYAGNLSAVATLQPVFAEPISVNNPVICAGQQATFTVSNPVADATYKWYDNTGLNLLNTGISFISPALNNAINYIVRIEGADCAVASSTVTATVNPQPAVSIAVFPATIYSGTAATLTAIVSGGTTTSMTYTWYEGVTEIGTTTVNTYATEILSTPVTYLYSVMVLNSYGCSATADITLIPVPEPVELFIPDVFTPNGDNVNDYFHIVGLHLFEENELTIVNKRGKLVYSKRNYDNSWDGEGQPDDIYYYQLRVVTAGGATTTHKGYVYIKRR